MRAGTHVKSLDRGNPFLKSKEIFDLHSVLNSIIVFSSSILVMFLDEQRKQFITVS